ncbi:hypothetical protein [Sphingosinicella sp. CPCC 101087]|uniref:hypothetical protein n=1 Tax=Sphingosinicella sp. CPCC 101087 TaxID=2497754 RepID=UPI00101B8F2F|nr:hypothetical protein [Sphingosinicella sp. CPCC 101087]
MPRSPRLGQRCDRRAELHVDSTSGAAGWSIINALVLRVETRIRGELSPRMRIGRYDPPDHVTHANPTCSRHAHRS